MKLILALIFALFSVGSFATNITPDNSCDFTDRKPGDSMEGICCDSGKYLITTKEFEDYLYNAYYRYKCIDGNTESGSGGSHRDSSGRTIISSIRKCPSNVQACYVFDQYALYMIERDQEENRIRSELEELSSKKKIERLLQMPQTQAVQEVEKELRHELGEEYFRIRAELEGSSSDDRIERLQPMSQTQKFLQDYMKGNSKTEKYLNKYY